MEVMLHVRYELNKFSKLKLTLGSSRWAVAFVLIGLIIRIYILVLSNGSPLVSDSKGYHSIALQMDTSSSFSTYWPPALPFYLHLWHKMFGPSEAVSKVAMIPWYILLCVFLFLLVRKVLDTAAANVSILTLTFFPTFIYHSISPLTQLPAAVSLVLIGYLLIKHMEKPKVIYPVVLGLTFAFLVLLRPSSIALLFLVGVYYIFRAKRITSFVVMMTVVMVIVSSWIYKAHSMTGRLVLINDANSRNLFYGNNRYTPLYKTWWLASHGKTDEDVPQGFKELMQEIESKPLDIQQRIMGKIAVEHIIKRPDFFLIRTLSRIRCFFTFPTFTGSILHAMKFLSRKASLLVIFVDAIFYSVIMLGAAIFLWSKGLSLFDDVYYRIILIIILGYAVPYWFSFSHPTYNFPTIPMFLILSMGFMRDSRSARIKEILWSGGRIPFLLILCVYSAIQLEWILNNISRI